MVPQVSRSASLLSELGSTDRNVTVMPVPTVDKVAAVVADTMPNIVTTRFWRDRTVVTGGTPHPSTCPIVAHQDLPQVSRANKGLDRIVRISR